MGAAMPAIFVLVPFDNCCWAGRVLCKKVSGATTYNRGIKGSTAAAAAIAATAAGTAVAGTILVVAVDQEKRVVVAAVLVVGMGSSTRVGGVFRGCPHLSYLSN
jgi:hypothetical protein